MQVEAPTEMIQPRSPSASPLSLVPAHSLVKLPPFDSLLLCPALKCPQISCSVIIFPSTWQLHFVFLYQMPRALQELLSK